SRVLARRAVSRVPLPVALSAADLVLLITRSYLLWRHCPGSVTVRTRREQHEFYSIRSCLEYTNVSDTTSYSPVQHTSASSVSATGVRRVLLPLLTGPASLRRPRKSPGDLAARARRRRRRSGPAQQRTGQHRHHSGHRIPGSAGPVGGHVPANQRRLGADRR